MKIGIITWFKYENYGTILQALSLQKYLRNQGYSVELIDYKIPKIEKNNSKKNKKTLYLIKGKIKRKIMLKLNRKKINKKTSDFKKIINEQCIVSRYVENDKEYINLCNQYDILIFGSDQIWNPNWFHPFYFADFDEIKCYKIAYAPSLGVNKLDETSKRKLKNALQKFNEVSMREEIGCKLVGNLLEKEIKQVVDPTFLLKDEWNQWIENYPIKQDKYILCYMLSDNKNHWKAIKKYSKKTRLPVYVIPQSGNAFKLNKKVLYDVNVGNFLYLIKNAEYVITDSFHATVFSLIYKKNFILFERHNPLELDSQNSRLTNLLEIICMKKSILEYNSCKIEENYYYDYNKIEKELNKKIIDSKKYLNESLENINQEVN